MGKPENLGLFLEKGFLGEKGAAAHSENPNKLLQELDKVFKEYKPSEAELRRIVEETRRAAETCHGRILSLTAEVETPLLIGLGSPSPYEAHLHTSLPHGHPVIEASSVKGVARFYAENFMELSTKEIREIFGQQEGMGQVVWLPGLPLNYKVGRTVINVHYPEYYRAEGRVEFREWEDPRLIHLPCVLPGGKFWFGVAGRDEEILGQAFKILREALETLGLGGKTRVGFGKFRLIVI